jgi:hypothetical protein
MRCGNLACTGKPFTEHRNIGELAEGEGVGADGVGVGQRREERAGGRGHGRPGRGCAGQRDEIAHDPNLLAADNADRTCRARVAREPANTEGSRARLRIFPVAPLGRSEANAMRWGTL